MSFLSKTEDCLDCETICRFAGGTLPMPELYQTIDSTNIRAKAWAFEGAPEGSAVLADAQTAGHGRYGRPFFSGAGQGLYMSLILRPCMRSDLFPQLTFYAALAVCEALEALCPSLDLSVKWVNDVYLGGKKLAGILTETVISPETQKIEAAIIGIGINLCGALPKELEGFACVLASATTPPSRNRLAGEIIARLLSAEREIENGSYLARYRRRCFVLSKEITVHAGESSYPATAIGIGEDGSLTVRLANGDLRALTAGEVSIRLDRGTHEE